MLYYSNPLYKSCYVTYNIQKRTSIMFQNPQAQTLTHLSKILGYLHSKQFNEADPVQISGTIKRNQSHEQQSEKKVEIKSYNQNRKEIKWRLQGSVGTNIRNFQLESQKLQWCGIYFGAHNISLIQTHLREIAISEKLLQVRFWGVIRGVIKDYYIIQGRKQPYKSNDAPPVGGEKNGEGANYYSYWVTNSLQQSKWTQLPDILPTHIRAARKIKLMFTGQLEESIMSYPQFQGKQKHYLKAQLSRITHALQLAPKGVYKTDENNPKLIQFEEEVKIPEFAELNTLQGWVHRNQMILNLGRCSHFVDPKLPEEEIQAKMNQLVEKDPQAQRLKGINEDKIPEQLGLGLENPWLLRIAGNTQVFTKDEGSLVYGVIVLKNIYWPGWTTIGYKNGYSNIYIGNGLKSTQTSLNIYQNPDLEKDAQDINEYPEPYPRQLPKEQPPAEGEPKPEDE